MSVAINSQLSNISPTIELFCEHLCYIYMSVIHIYIGTIPLHVVIYQNTASLSSIPWMATLSRPSRSTGGNFISGNAVVSRTSNKVYSIKPISISNIVPVDIGNCICDARSISFFSMNTGATRPPGGLNPFTGDQNPKLPSIMSRAPIKIKGRRSSNREFVVVRSGGKCKNHTNRP